MTSFEYTAGILSAASEKLRKVFLCGWIVQDIKIGQCFADNQHGPAKGVAVDYRKENRCEDLLTGAGVG